MKKTILIIGLLLVIVLIACIPEQLIVEQKAEVVCNHPYIRFGKSCCLDKNVNNICDFDELEEPVEEEVPVEVYPTEDDITPLMQKIYQKALTKTQKGYSYTFENKKYFARGNRTKIELPEYLKLGYSSEFKITNVIDTIYFDKEIMQAQGYCEQAKYRTGYEIACRKLQDYPFVLVFGDYYVKSPLDWLKEYKSKNPFFVKELEKPVNEQPSITLIFDEGQVLTTFWIDYKTALPLRIEVRQKNNGVTALYDWHDYEYYVSPDEVVH